MTIEPQRGHVYRIQDPEYGTLHCLAVAVKTGPDGGDCLAVRVTVTGQRLSFPGWVRMGSGDPAGGYITVSDIEDLDHVDREELVDDLGVLSPETMMLVEKELRKMLGL